MKKIQWVFVLFQSCKTTLAKKFAALHLEADMFFVQNGSYNYEPHKIKEAHAWCQNSVRHALRTGLDVVVANTFVKAWKVENYAKIARNLNATFSIEVATGKFENIHGVAEEKIARMRNDWEDIVIDMGIVSRKC